MLNKFLVALLVPFIFLENAFADHLSITYGDYDVAPFVLIKDGVLAEGIIKDIGDELAHGMGLKPTYIQIPRKRLPTMIESGEVHMRIIFNPDWLTDSHRFHWSDVMFEDKSILVVRRQDAATFDEMNQFLGKRIGAIFGQVYPSFQEFFIADMMTRDDSINLESNLRRLEKNRIDAVLTTEMAFKYTLRSFINSDAFQDSQTLSEPHQHFIMYSKNTPWKPSVFKNAFDKMRQSNRFHKIVDKYQ